MLSQITHQAGVDFNSTAAFVTAEGWSVSYAELDLAVTEAAAGLRERGIVEGSVVALTIPSTVDYVVLFLAAARLGAVTAGLNPGFTAPETRACLDVVTADLVIDEADLGPQAGHASGVAAPFRIAGALPPPPLDDDPNRPVCICFTSGSTGAPKGAWFANRQLKTIAALDAAGAWGGGGHAVASTQFAHVGFMTKLAWMLAGGRTTHLLPRWSAGPVLRLIATHKIAAVTGVAPQIALLVRHALATTLDFEHVQAIVVGGAASPPALVALARSCFGAPYSIRYSSTESGGIGLGTALDAPDEEALYTIGRPRFGVSAVVRDEHGRDLPAGEIGELWLTSGAVMSGYWNQPDATAEALVDGWLRTGDLAHLDETGAFRLAGRITEMFIRGGYNVYPMEVESVLSTHRAVAEVAVVPRPDAVMGEIGVAVVTVADGADPPSLSSLRDHGAAHLASYKLPEDIRVVAALPRNASNKVDRRRLAATEPIVVDRAT